MKDDDEEQYAYVVKWSKKHPVDYVRIGLLVIVIFLICGLIMWSTCV